mgnify:CR=1 FL=1
MNWTNHNIAWVFWNAGSVEPLAVFEKRKESSGVADWNYYYEWEDLLKNVHATHFVVEISGNEVSEQEFKYEDVKNHLTDYSEVKQWLGTLFPFGNLESILLELFENEGVVTVAVCDRNLISELYKKISSSNKQIANIQLGFSQTQYWQAFLNEASEQRTSLQMKGYSGLLANGIKTFYRSASLEHLLQKTKRESRIRHFGMVFLMVTFFFLVANTWWYSRIYKENQLLKLENRKLDGALEQIELKNQATSISGLSDLPPPDIESFSLLANTILSISNDVKVVELHMFPLSIKRKEITQDREHIYYKARCSHFEAVNKLISQIEIIKGVKKVELEDITSMSEGKEIEFLLTIALNKDE